MAIAVPTLLIGSALPFRLFTRIGDSFVLHGETGARFDAVKREELLSREIHELHVRSQDRDLYTDYLRTNISGLLTLDESRTQESLDRFYQTSIAVTQAFLDDPASEASAATARVVIESGLDQLASDRHIMSLLTHMEVDSPDLYEHSLRVTFYGLALARSAGITDPAKIASLGMGLLLHDVGKTLQPEPPPHSDPLTEDEWSEVREHPALGLQAVGDNPLVDATARDVILLHHERLDGSGYPGGRADLPIHVRIAAIVNHFDRRTTNATYRQARTGVEVLREMILVGKNQFDVKLIARIVRLLGS